MSQYWKRKEIENTRFGQRNKEANKHHMTIIG
jgi:hypothetical protein